MKISIIVQLTLVATSTFFLQTTNACEKTCQVGISDTFAKHYDNETSVLWDNFADNLTDTICNKTNIDSYIPNKSDIPILNSKLKAIIKNRVTTFHIEFNSSLSATIGRAIFRQQKQPGAPKAFRGDCNHPFRVKQPKPPAIWTREDCEKMDYICGNPPSICHFLDEVKKRNYAAINDAFRLLTTNGTFLNVITDGVYMTLKRTGIFNTTGLDDVMSVTKPDVDGSLKDFADTFEMNFCTGKKCDIYDEEIKTQLLTYP